MNPVHRRDAPPKRGDAPAILIMARAPRRGEVRRALEPMLGPQRCLALQAELIRATVAWGQAAAPGRVHLAYEPAEADLEVRALVGAVHLMPQHGDGLAARVGEAVGRVLADDPGPLLVVWPDLPCWRPAHASGALEDLADGCAAVLGPCVDGGLYLLGLSRALPELFAIPEDRWRGGGVVAAVFAAASHAQLDVGMLRAERALRRPGDVRAVRADPLLPEPLRAILGR